MRFLHGFSFGVCTTCIMTVLSRMLTSENMAQGMSYFGLGQGVSIAIAPAFGLYLRNNFEFKGVFLVSSVISFIVFALSFFVKSTATNINKNRGHFKKNLIPIVVTSGVVCLIGSLETVFIISYGESLGVTSLGWYFTVSAIIMIGFRMVFAQRFNHANYKKTMTFSLFLMGIAMIILFLNGFIGSFLVFILASIIKSIGQSCGQPVIQKESVAVAENKVIASSSYYFGCDLGQCLGPIIGGFTASILGHQYIFLFGAIVVVVYLFVSWKFNL